MQLSMKFVGCSMILMLYVPYLPRENWTFLFYLFNGQLSDLFNSDSIILWSDTFLELLEPYILKDMLGSLPPEVFHNVEVPFLFGCIHIY